MILNYFGIRILVKSENNRLYNFIEEKYKPIIKVEEDNDECAYSILVNSGEIPYFCVDNDYKRKIIHGGNVREYYITALVKQEKYINKIYFDKDEVYVIVNSVNNQITCYGNRLEKVFKIFDLIIIELFFRTMEIEKQYYHFHASAISDIEGNVIMFMGAKNAGKTSFLMEALLRHNFKYVCNDNCLVGLDENNDINIIPWFEDLKIKQETLKKYNLDVMKISRCKYSGNGEKIFIPLSIAIEKYQIEYVEPKQLKEIVILEYKEGNASLDREWKSNTLNEIYNNVKVPHDPEHYEFLGLFEEFDEDRFEKLDLLVKKIKDNVTVTKITYDNESLGWAMDRLVDRKIY